METTVMNVAVSHGIWAVLAVFLLVYIVKSNEKRDEKQEEREKNYQSVIEKLTEKLEILHQVQSDLSEIKENLFGKHKHPRWILRAGCPRNSEHRSRRSWQAPHSNIIER